MKPLVPEHGSFLDALTKGLDEGKKKQWKFRATTLVLTHAVAIPGYGDIFWMGLYDNGSDSPKSSSEFLKKTDDSWYPVAYARMARQGGTHFFERFVRYRPVCARCRGCRVGRTSPELPGVVATENQSGVYTDALTELKITMMIFSKSVKQ